MNIVGSVRPAFVVGGACLKSAWIAAGVCFLAAGCADAGEEAFIKSHRSLHAGLSMAEAFGAGLADYMKLMGTKNVAGATVPARQPVGAGCRRHVLDIAFTGVYRVRVYCDINAPTARQLVPEKAFADQAALLRALETEYRGWAAEMEFRVESPPRQLFGVYDSYRFTTDRGGMIVDVFPIVSSRP